MTPDIEYNNMLRTPVSKRISIQIITLIVALAALVTIWPLRLYHETMSYYGGRVTEISELVTENEDAGEYFTAQYDHLDSIEVYIESVEEGDKFTAQLFDQSDGTNTQLAVEQVSFPKEDLPCYVTIPIDVDLVPGNVYVLILTGHVRKEDPSTFRVGFESAEDAAANPQAPIYNVAFHHDTSISGLALAMRTHYVEPLTKAKSALAAGVVLLLTVLSLAAQRLYYKRRPQAEHLVPLLTVLQYALTPVIVIPAALAAIAVFPLRLYDSRVMDVLLYEFGIIVAALFLLYGLWHDRVGLPERVKTPGDILARLREILMVIDIALIIRSACTYLNAVNDYVHRDCEAQIVVGLAVLILLLGRVSWAVNIWTVLTAAAMICRGVINVRTTQMLLVSEGGKEIEEQMANVISQSIAAGFLAVAFVSVLVMLVDVLRGYTASGHAKDPAQEPPKGPSKESEKAMSRSDGPSAELSCVIRADGTIRTRKDEPAGRLDRMISRVLIVALAAFLVLTAICRNGRTWLLVLALVWTLLYARYACSEIRHRSGAWLRVVAYGILLHFACNVVWTMMFRYYLAYNYSRFSMQFHTVTVTAYYLLMVSAAALSLFLTQFRAVYVLPWRERLRRMWKEIAILGVVCSYMIMSMTRAGVYSLAVIAIVGTVCAFGGTARSLRRVAKCLGTIALVTVLTFPSVFTGQRIISTTVAEPVIYAPVESYFDVLMRHAPWNSTEFMNLEIFLRDSMDRLIGGGIGSQIYYRLRWNIPQGYATASADEENYYLIQGPLVAAVSDEIIAGITTGNYTGNGFSNGRTDIWRAYLAEMNMTGHEGMTLTLPDGEIAIHAHNILIQMAYDCGVPAGVLFAAILALTLVGSGLYYKRRRGRDAAMLPLLVTLGFLLTGMVEWIYHLDNPYTIVLLLVLAPVMFRDKAE